MHESIRQASCCHTTFWAKQKNLSKRQCKVAIMKSFNLIQVLMSLAFFITFSMYICVLITLMLVNLIVLKVNMFVYSCNVLYVCK
jgi:hypothetical protein